MVKNPPNRKDIGILNEPGVTMLLIIHMVKQNAI